MPRTTSGPLAALLLICATVTTSFPQPTLARTVTWARAFEAPTLDPHAHNDGASLTLNQQIYEPLLLRDAQGKTAPALAEGWSSTSDPLVWEFRLRRGVLFHDGTPFTAEDVVFSVNRAKTPLSGIKDLLQSVEQVTAVDSHLVRIKTRSPTPLLPASLTHVLIMSKVWADKNGVTLVPAPTQTARAHTFKHANGTGPFVLVSREPGSRTVMRRHDTYWGNLAAPVEITELIYRPIPNDTERVQALIAGEVDFVQDVPVNELPRLQANKAFTVSVGPENRSVFIGLNVGQAGPQGGLDSARNPLADKRVREAINVAINRQAIQRGVLLGQAIPTGTVAPSSINGYPRQLDRLPPHDPARGKVLISEAGFPNGFKLTLDCPREGIIRAEAVCRAVGTQLAAVGITVETVVRDTSQHLAQLRSEVNPTDFYLAGISVPSFDSEQILLDLYHTRDERSGRANATRYSNKELDRLIDSLAGQVDFSQRTQTIAQAWRLALEDMIYVPLHVQTVAYAMKADLTINVDIENQPKMKFARIKMPIQ